MRRRRAQVSEAQLAEVVVRWLEALGADVYQEVECAGGVADVVACVRAELWIVETKTAWSLQLLCQAMDRRREAHRVFIAAPYSRTLNDTSRICDALGIGVLDVHLGSEGCNAGEGYGMPAVREVVASRRWNTRPVALAAKLCPEHKTHAKAGTNGGRWTPFRRTIEQVASVVRNHPGITLKELVGEIKHHYQTDASARNSIAHWVFHGKVPGVRLVPGDKHATLEPTETR